jgi:hypothetical protein
MDAMKSLRLNFAALAIMSAALPLYAPAWTQSSPGSTAVLAAPQRDGSHDFDFLIGELEGSRSPATGPLGGFKHLDRI